jgi:DNA-directed RNA polymerase II subunit RPB1
MASHSNESIPKQKSAKIIGIQFSILSPDEIRRGSVAEITSRDTYINNKPVIGGLFDPRMGVLEPGLICPTDGLDYMKTPGYFGHIELSRPVFYIQYLNTIMKILRSVCIKCSKLKISKENYKQAMKKNADERWNYVFQLASKVTRCGDDSDDGCGCLQPKKIKKEGLATLFAEWDNINGLNNDDDPDKMNMKLTPEIVLKIFRRISDDDVNFMGFSPVFSRPDWMICQVLAVPPPAVRPSIKMDGQQRSEDDISHILVNIIKANKTLQEKIQENANANIVDDWHTVLQYYIATQVDNKIPGVASVAQRSGRPLKSIKERLNGKGGRVRGNLMGKRVDFSARSVITPDPNLSIRELGIPLKVAKNITKPVTVNDMNKRFLIKLVRAGPEEYPGAKILEKKNGEQITLRYADRENASDELENGDIVHRHMMDGDGVLFNRQPTLHRMSMMCHIAVIMYKGDTFRMNVADTKPYNADFDGDEMNLHMPQDEESEAELKNLAAVPYQIISPANNASIVGVFQDSLLGAYRFTRPDIKFNQLDAMNLLMSFNKINTSALKKSKEITSFEIMSQIMPPLTMKFGNKWFEDSGEEKSNSNHVIEIVAGKYIRGQMEKSVLGSGGNGLLQRVCNYYGNMAAADFVDNLQNVVTEYMKTSCYSVGISDLISDKSTNEKIADTITNKKKDVKNLIDQTHLGIFENKTGKSNEEEFETQVTNILNNATNEAGKIGRESLEKGNRFVIMVNAGSKGSDINISQMISCLGQQTVDGKRIPYGFENRTLPHYTKYDDSPVARGFVESSFISGLSPEELFFHAMGGRVGLIDTAVKTSQTGYIQRRLIKGLEDLKVEYDMTVRNNKQRIVQFSYGDDGIDTVRVENQVLPIVAMSLEELYVHYHIPSESDNNNVFMITYTKGATNRMKKQNDALVVKTQEYINYMIEMRDKIVDNIFHNTDSKMVHIPVSFKTILNNIQGLQNINKNSMVDITPLETFQLVENNYKKLEQIYYVPPTELFKVMYYYYLSPKELLLVKRFNRKTIISMLEMITSIYKNAIVAPGEMVGMIAAQSIGEPTTQMTLNTFHFAGVASKSNVTRGVPRIEEILSLSENPKNPSVTIYLPTEESGSRESVQKYISEIEYTKMKEIVSAVEICFDPDDLNSLIEEDEDTLTQYYEFENLVSECTGHSITDNKEKSKWIIRLEMDKESMLDKNITMDDINFAISNTFDDDVHCVYSDYNSDKLIFRLRLNNILSKRKGNQANPLDQSDEIYILKNFQDNLLNNIILSGVKDISKVVMRKITNNVVLEEGIYNKQESWVLDTVGTNLLKVLSLDFIDATKTISNDIQEIYRTFGIEAARNAIFSELTEVIEFDSTYINYHHLSMLCDRMCYKSKMISIFRHGINNDDIGPIAKASFEETPEMFLKAARHGELDPMRGVSANVMCGQQGYFGTSAFQVLADINAMMDHEAPDYNMEDDNILHDETIGEVNTNEQCSINNLTINNNAINIKNINLGQDDDYDIEF